MSFSFDEIIERRSTNSLKWTRYGKEVLPLWVADMDFPAPEPARHALERAVQHGIYGYEMPTRKLAATVAERMQRLYAWRVTADMVVATPGIVAAFNVAARTLCSPGSGIVIQPPVYAPFLKLPQQTGAVGQLAPLRRLDEGSTIRYSIDWEVFESALSSSGTRPGMLLLCNPHNPTGQIYRRPELERMAEICLRHETPICSDEIHSELLLGGAQHFPLAALSDDLAARTITLVSPSKTFNLVGLFCGFAIIPDRELRVRYEGLLLDMAMHVNSFGLIAAEAALGGDCDGWLSALRQYLTGNRDLLVDFVRQELAGVRVTVPDATYLGWLDFGELVKAGRVPDDVYQFLLTRAKVALNPGAEFGPGGEHCVRLNFGCPRSALREALERIRGAIQT